MKQWFVIVLITFALTGCFKEEDPWVKGQVSATEIIELGDDYGDQVFYKLSSAEVVATNEYVDWDIAFYSQANDFFIKLNAARNMHAYDTESQKFEAVSAISSSWEHRYDDPNGNMSILAIDAYASLASFETIEINSNVFIIDRGMDPDGISLGEPIKLVVEKFENDAYFIRFSNLNGSNEHEVVVHKDPTVEFVSFSFDTPNQLPIVEPDRNTWDLIFTRFTDTVYTTDGSEYLTGYAVTGAYLNQAFTEAYQLNGIDYETFTLTDVTENKFSNRLNVIGHDWKVFQNVYTIIQDRMYVIKDKNDLIYKLQFTDFYNPDNGRKGYPQFEFELL